MRGSFGLTVQQQLMASAAAIVMVASASPAMAQTRTFDVPAGPASRSIPIFAKQAGVQILASGDTVKAKRTKAVKGNMTVQEGLRRLLEGSGLAPNGNANGIITIGAVTVGNGGDATAEGGDQTAGIAEILVTGRRTLNVDIRRTENDAQPYVVFDSNQIKKSGATNISDFVQSRLMAAPSTLPPNTQLIQTGNASSIDLRGLGASQTLILINGRRAPGYSYVGGDVQPDLNNIPLAAIERIEVLPTSASGIYGGNATGGVVNVVLKDNYRGLDVSTGYGNSFQGGGESKQLFVSAGFSPDRGRTNIAFFGGYTKEGSLYSKDRDFFSIGRGAVLNYNPGFFFNTPFPPLGATPNIRSQLGTPLTLDNGTILSSTFTFVPTGYSGRGSDGGAALAANAGKYNLGLAPTAQSDGGAYTPLIVGSTTKSGRLTIRHDFSDRISGFVEISANENSSATLLNQIPRTFIVNGTAPNNPFTQNIRVTIPTIGADDRIESKLKGWGGIAGLIVRLPNSWTLGADLSRQYSSLSYTAPSLSIDPVATAAIRTGAIDILRDVSAYPVDLGQYALQPLVAAPIKSNSTIGTARFGGPVIRLPGGSLALSGFIEFRHQEIGETIVREAGGYQLWPDRSQDVRSGYLEATLPIFSASPNAFEAPALELKAAGRYDWYTIRSTGSQIVFDGQTPGPITRATNSFRSVTPTFALRFSPVKDLIFRASYAEGYLPPALTQIVPSDTQPVSAGLGLIDPKRGNESVGNIDFLTGGNPDLRPEQSKSISIGAIVTPQIIPNLRFSFDWTKIRKRDSIAVVVGTQNQAAIDNEDVLPGTIIRAPMAAGDQFGVGKIVAINGRFLNLSNVLVSAFDYKLDYSFETARFGKFGVSAAASQLLNNRVQITPVTTPIENSGVSLPKWNAYGTFSWNIGKLHAEWSARYFDKKWFNLAHTPDLNTGLRQEPSAILHDIFIEIEDIGTFRNAPKFDIQLGIRNVFNEKPSIVGAGNFFDPRIDPRLRRFWVKLSTRFGSTK